MEELKGPERLCSFKKATASRGLNRSAPNHLYGCEENRPVAVACLIFEDVSLAVRASHPPARVAVNHAPTSLLIVVCC